MKYITVPPAIETRHPVTDEPCKLKDGSPEVITFTNSCRIALTLIANKKGADILAIYDLRTKLDRAKPGESVELTDEEWNVLSSEFKRPDPQAFGTPWIFSAGPHVRAVLEASGTKP